MNNIELGNIVYVSDKNLMCQVFPEGIKQSMLYICVMTDKGLYFPDSPTTFNNEVIAGACEKINDNNRVIPFEDIDRIVYPTEDVKIMLWMKRKGDRNIRIYRKSTGKYCDVCVGRAEDTKKVYNLLVSKKDDEECDYGCCHNHFFSYKFY